MFEHFDEYQAAAKTTAVYPGQGCNFTYPALGLNGESGEVAEHAKKVLRDDFGFITEQRREKIKYELGDVLWYVAICADEAGLSFSEIAEANLDKLKKRMEEGKIQGSGSER